MTTLIDRINGLLRFPSAIPEWFFQLLARLAIAPTFWLSGQNKLAGWSVSDGTIMLMRHEWGMPYPELSAWLATFAENIFSVLLVIGLLTRLSAWALFVMALVIQFYVYWGNWVVFWNTHILWFFPLLFIMARGPGKMSADHLLAPKLGLGETRS